jgi:pantothenate synthetase
VTRIDGETLAAVAVTIGETRLIDNCLIPDPRAR